jgi:hypothetical protein
MVCDDGTSVQITCFWTSCLSLKCRPVYISKHNVSETGFCLRLQVKPTQLGPIDRASPYFQTPVLIEIHLRCKALYVCSFVI